MRRPRLRTNQWVLYLPTRLGWVPIERIQPCSTTRNCSIACSPITAPTEKMRMESSISRSRCTALSTTSSQDESVSSTFKKVIWPTISLAGRVSRSNSPTKEFSTPQQCWGAECLFERIRQWNGQTAAIWPMRFENVAFHTLNPLNEKSGNG